MSTFKWFLFLTCTTENTTLVNVFQFINLDSLHSTLSMCTVNCVVGLLLGRDLTGILLSFHYLSLWSKIWIYPKIRENSGKFLLTESEIRIVMIFWKKRPKKGIKSGYYGILLSYESWQAGYLIISCREKINLTSFKSTFSFHLTSILPDWFLVFTWQIFRKMSGY